MTGDDFDRFGRALRAVAEAIGAPITTERTMLYFERLKRFEIDQVENALGRGQDRWKFFPAIPEVIEAIEGSPDDRTLAAWTRVETALREVGTYQSVTFDDPILHATVMQMGGWFAAWEWERLDERDYGFKRLEFTRLYRMFLGMGAQTAPRYLLGQAEVTNRETRNQWLRGLPNPALEIPEHVDEILRIDAGGRSVGALPPASRQQLQGRREPRALPGEAREAGAPS